MKKKGIILLIVLFLSGLCRKNGGHVPELPELVKELSNPSGEILEIMDRCILPPVQPDITSTLSIAKGWIEQIISEPCQPAEHALYIPFTGDGKKSCDIIRVHYPACNRDIQIAQTFCIISIVVHWPLPKDKSVEEHLQQVAQFVLNNTQRLNLEIVQQSDTLTIAQQKVSDPPPEYMDYIDHIIVWTDNFRIGIATLKKGKHPGRAVMSWEKDFNCSWYSLYKNH